MKTAILISLIALSIFSCKKEDVASTAVQYKYGADSFKTFIKKTIHYPAIARENELQDTVSYYFEVNENGEMGQIILPNPNHESLDNEVINTLLKTKDNWLSATYDGKAIKEKYEGNIKFRLK